jgi:hypothetical protein
MMEKTDIIISDEEYEFTIKTILKLIKILILNDFISVCVNHGKSLSSLDEAIIISKAINRYFCQK